MNRFLFLSGIIMLPLVACGGGISISDIQGNGPASSMVGETVTIEGIVTGDFQDNDADDSGDLGGFFLQAELADSDASTSDGVFVFDGKNAATDVTVGDKLAVTGLVKEFFGETQIAASSLTIIGSGALKAVALSLPAAGITTNSDGDLIADLEAYEGMLVRIEQTLTVTELYNLERYGELRLAVGGRLYQFTNGNAPDAAGYASHRETNAAGTLTLDDGHRNQNPAPIPYLDGAASPAGALRVGDSVAGLTGNLRFARASGSNGSETWRLMPTSAPVFVADNPRPGAPDIGGELRVASFNVLNFFTTIDSGDRVCGPSARSNCRGADSDEEFGRQLDKITTALAMIDADIVGLIELENNQSRSLQAIVDSLNVALGANTYAILDTRSIGDDAIRTGFIFKPASVALRGPHAILDSSVDSQFDDSRNRPALAQTFSQRSNDARLTVVVNHLKSKGSSCDRDDDPNTHDGQGNCNQTRRNAAVAIANWLQTDPTASDDPDFLIIGDPNAHVMEDPLKALKDAGFVNLVEIANVGYPYSYVFDGQSGALDHALVSSSLLPQIAATIEWHINADEAPVHDYNLEHGRDPAIFDGTTPYRASDHDPVIIGLDLSR
jgi:predicted extracellular nuclease